MRAAPLQPMEPRSHRGFVVFRWAIYAVLGLNVVLYARYGRLTELLDTGAWFVLLLLFEWETGGWRLPARLRHGVHAVRGLCAVALAVALGGYAVEREWLDFGNAATWLAVVLMLELELRLSPDARRLHRLRRGLTAALYAVLAGFVATWTVDAIDDGGAEAALDAWDSFWWLVAFLVIELNIFGFARPAESAAGPAA